MNWEKEFPLPEKERQLFCAVEQLLAEGMDINCMKVSDITERAGIGKGTAYEYFKSKQELIVKALAFQVWSGLTEVERRMSEKMYFSEKVRVIFDWLEENGEKTYIFQNFMKISMQSYEIAKPFQDKWCQLLEGPGRKLYSSMIGQLLDTGRKDGMISSGIKDAQAAQVLISQAMGYLVYLQNKTWAEGVTQKEMKDFVCKSLLKCLK